MPTLGTRINQAAAAAGAADYVCVSPTNPTINECLTHSKVPSSLSSPPPLLCLSNVHVGYKNAFTPYRSKLCSGSGICSKDS